ncbi:hypothetical protein THAOC_16684 [Thalassiosira oceanica]|uniref:Uncharacterized protein n=1 Tax=Thalassiosira oceanica TaxID=159749 RepID=K0S9C1_THAOC|nr:hypothetical protein THAOC_16684 [Thalassiosira oceanica]|eukprot:EJK62693.1 hypothetical protein THAOC_16684 [Thalassiosira oceanica]
MGFKELNSLDEMNAMPEIEPSVMNEIMNRDERIDKLIRVRKLLFLVDDSLESNRRRKAKDEFEQRYPSTLTAERLEEVLGSKILSRRIDDVTDSSYTVAGVVFKSGEDAQAWLSLFPPDMPFRMVERHDETPAFRAVPESDHGAQDVHCTLPWEGHRSLPARTTRSSGWAPMFKNTKIFEGSVNRSTLNTCKKDLAKVMSRFQKDINSVYPRSRSKTAVASNAVLSDILLRGNSHAVGFIESWMPFYRFLAKSGMSKGDAWDTVLAYRSLNNHVFWDLAENVAVLREIGHEGTDGEKLFAIIKCAAELDEYAQHEWIQPFRAGGTADRVYAAGCLGGLADASVEWGAIRLGNVREPAREDPAAGALIPGASRGGVVGGIIYGNVMGADEVDDAVRDRKTHGWSRPGRRDHGGFLPP